MLTDAERELVQRVIAACIDHPSVYMGGPSRDSMRKADKIIAYLVRSKRLVPTTCDHAAWRDFKQHGACCPDCDAILPEKMELSTSRATEL